MLGLIWGGVWYELTSIRRGHLGEIERTVRFETQAFAENARSSIQRIDESLLELRAGWIEAPGQFASLVQRRQNFINDLAFQVAVIDADGYLAFSNLRYSTDRIFLGEREHFSVHRKAGVDQLFISEPVMGKVSGKVSIQFTRPVFQGQAFKGVIVISVSPETFSAFHKKLPLGESSVMTLIGESGAILARHPDMGDFIGKKISGSPFQKPGVAISGNFTRVALVDGLERIFGFYRMPEYKLNFVIGHATRDVLVPYVQRRGDVLIAAAVLSVLAALLLVQLNRSIAASSDAEARLLASQAMMRSAIDTIGEAFVIYDTGDRLIFCNEQYRQFYLSSADLLVPGARFEDIIRIGAERGQYKEAVGRIEEWVAQRMIDHRAGNSDIVQQLDDGRWLRVRERKTPEGYTVGFRIDITELVRANEKVQATLAELRVSQERLSFALKGSGDAVWEWNVEQGTIRTDKQWLDRLGYGEHELIEDISQLQNTIHPADFQTLTAAVVSCLQGKTKSFAVENRACHKDGSITWVLTRGMVATRDASGRGLRVVGTHSDISERKKVERMKDEFISTVSHELRTPLTSIRGSLGLLEGGVLGALPSKALEIIKVANKNSQRLICLVNDILDMEKLLSGQMTMNTQPIDLREMVHQSIEANSGYALSFHVRLALVTDVGQPIVVGDQDRLMQVMANLLSNAAKFSPAGSVVEIRILPGQGVMWVEVEDHGAGIPVDFQRTIFGEFAQADASNTRQRGGTGLGLNISKKLIERMGGEIGYRTVQGEGTVFWFSVPSAVPLNAAKVIET